MTFREKMAQEHPNGVCENYGGGCYGCPQDYGYETNKPCRDQENKSTGYDCSTCWDREMPMTPAKGDKGLSDTDAMRRAVQMLLRAEAIMLLPDWEQSGGAFAELMLARRLGLVVVYREDMEESA